MGIDTARRIEQQHNTPEQVREYVREALAVVDELDVPDDLRAAAFAKACDLISGKQIVFEQPASIAFDPRILQ